MVAHHLMSLLKQMVIGAKTHASLATVGFTRIVSGSNIILRDCAKTLMIAGKTREMD